MKKKIFFDLAQNSYLLQYWPNQIFFCKILILTNTLKKEVISYICHEYHPWGRNGGWRDFEYICHTSLPGLPLFQSLIGLNRPAVRHAPCSFHHELNMPYPFPVFQVSSLAVDCSVLFSEPHLRPLLKSKFTPK